MTTGPQSTPPTVSPSLSSFVDPETLALARAALEANKKEKKPPKSGTFTRTYTSNNIPAASSIKDTINKVFQKYYGRDASETEITTWTPQILAKYKSKSGASRSTVKEVYKNGALISTEYLTADNEDPSIFLEERIKTQLASGKVEINELSIPEGPSGKYFVAVKNLAYDNGIKLSDNDALSYANKIVAGQVDENTVFNTIRESAASAFPSLADKIKAGLDLKTLASPYIQSMSDILEIPDTAIDLFDPQIRSAMAYTLPDGKVGTKSIYDFEKELRKDDRWQYTNKAREQAASVATTVLRDFGFMG
jgi:antitoxin component YwqK of YwqJK toxin-antitoxin module